MVWVNRLLFLLELIMKKMLPSYPPNSKIISPIAYASMHLFKHIVKPIQTPRTMSLTTKKKTSF